MATGDQFQLNWAPPTPLCNPPFLPFSDITAEDRKVQNLILLDLSGDLLNNLDQEIEFSSTRPQINVKHPHGDGCIYIEEDEIVLSSNAAAKYSNVSERFKLGDPSYKDKTILWFKERFKELDSDNDFIKKLGWSYEPDVHQMITVTGTGSGPNSEVIGTAGTGATIVWKNPNDTKTVCF